MSKDLKLKKKDSSMIMILSSGHYCELGNLIKFSNHDYYQGRLYWIFEKLEIQFLAEVLNNLEKRLHACHHHHWIFY